MQLAVQLGFSDQVRSDRTFGKLDDEALDIFGASFKFFIEMNKLLSGDGHISRLRVRARSVNGYRKLIKGHTVVSIDDLVGRLSGISFLAVFLFSVQLEVAQIEKRGVVFAFVAVAVAVTARRFFPLQRPLFSCHKLVKKECDLLPLVVASLAGSVLVHMLGNEL